MAGALQSLGAALRGALARVRAADDLYEVTCGVLRHHLGPEVMLSLYELDGAANDLDPRRAGLDPEAEVRAPEALLYRMAANLMVDQQGRLKILATVTDRGAVTKLLAHLGLPTAPPPRAAARDPTDGQMTFDFDAA